MSKAASDDELFQSGARDRSIKRRGTESDRVADTGFLGQVAGEISRLRMADKHPSGRGIDRMVRPLGHDARSGSAAAHSRLHKDDCRATRILLDGIKTRCRRPGLADALFLPSTNKANGWKAMIGGHRLRAETGHSRSRMVRLRY